MDFELNVNTNVKANSEVNRFFIRAIGKAKERFLADGDMTAIAELDNYIVEIDKLWQAEGYVSGSIASILDAADVIFVNDDDPDYHKLVHLVKAQLGIAA